MNNSAPRIWRAQPSWTVGSSDGFGKQPIYIKIIPAAVLVFLTIVGCITHWTVEHAMKVDMASDLETILKADVSALRLWVEDQCLASEQIIQDEEIHALCLDLVRQSNASDDWAARIRGGADLKRLRELMKPRLEANKHASFAVLRTDGVCVARMEDRGIGKVHRWVLPDHEVKLAHGQSVLTRPFRSPIESAEGEVLARAAPTMSVLVPLRDAQEKRIGTVSIRMKSVEALNSPLQVVQRGASGESIAFDRDGWLISQSRFEPQLREAGMLSKTDSSVLGLRLTDPGNNRLESARANVPPGEQAFTYGVQAAIERSNTTLAAASDVDVEGHRDYRGVPAVSAWAWLPDLNIGVMTKLDKDEAYHPLYVLRVAFLCIFTLLTLAAAGILVAGRMIQRKNSRLRLAMAQIEKLGQYTLEEEIGGGGMGTVYRAQHAMLRRPTAIKIMLPQAANTALDVACFEREVQLTSELTHPNTITIYDFGRSPDGLLYYAMEYLAGVNLHNLVYRTGPLPEARVIYILRQVCASLAEAHARGLIHRDIKPANLMLCEHGGAQDFVKVLDFGLVKPVRIDSRAAPIETGKDFVMGTVGYMSPEALIAGGALDCRTDIYSIGAVAYFLLTGTEVFASESLLEIASKHLNPDLNPDRPSLLIGRTISPDVEGIVLRCLAKKPSGRFQNVTDLNDALERCEDSAKWSVVHARQWWRMNSVVAMGGQTEDSGASSQVE